MELPPELVERFGPLPELGRGASGVVFRLGEDRALKVFPLTGDGAREARELALARRLDHPHLMPCLEAGTVGGVAFAVMPRAEDSLEAVLERPGTMPDAWRLLRQAAHGVAALHQAGVVHRDLKPANILVHEGQARVADFGMARAEDVRTLTATGTILGTPQYMSPEQARGQRATPASDIFALGVIAYEVLEGAPPYPDELSMGELLARVARGQRDPLQRSLTWLPGYTRRAVEAALAVPPEERPRDAAAWAEALGELPEAEVPDSKVATSDAPTRELAAAAVLPGDGAPRDAPPSTEASSRGSRPGLVAAVLAAGVLAGVVLRGGGESDVSITAGPPPSATPAAAATQMGSVPLDQHPVLGEATRALDRSYEALAEPFGVEGLEGVHYQVPARVAEARRFESRTRRRFLRLLAPEPADGERAAVDYDQAMVEYLGAVEAWLARLHEVLPSAEQEEHRVVRAVHEYAFRLPFVHLRMVEQRLQMAANLMAGEFATQRRATALEALLEEQIATLYEAIPQILGDGPWPVWGVLLRAELAWLLRRPVGHREARSVGALSTATRLARALDRPVSGPVLRYLTDAATRLRRRGHEEEALPCAARWQLWRAFFSALPRLPDTPGTAHDATAALSDWMLLREACPEGDPSAGDPTLLPTLRSRVESELAYLEGLVPGAAEEDPLRTTYAFRAMANLAESWTRTETARAHPLGCALRRRLAALGDRHPGTVTELFPETDQEGLRTALADLRGCS